MNLNRPFQRKYLLVFIVITCYSSLLICQCPTSLRITGNVNGQDSLDNFLLYHPDCKTLSEVILKDPNGSLFDLSALRNIDTIYGDFILEGVEINNLGGLENLKFIGGDLKIINNFSLKSIDGLRNLKAINKNLSIIGNSELQVLNGLDALVQADTFFIDFNLRLSEIYFPSLEKIHSTFEVGNSNGTRVYADFPILKEIGGIVLLNNLSGLNFPELELVNGPLNINELTGLSDFSGFNKLKRIEGHLVINASSELLQVAGFESLESINGNLELYGTSIEEISGFVVLADLAGSLIIRGNICRFSGLQNLRSIGMDYVVGKNKICLDLESLESIGGDMVIESKDITALDNFNELLTIAGHLDILTDFDTIAGFEKLTSIDSFSVVQYDNLKYLGGFNQLTNLNSNLEILSNKELTQITAFKNLHVVDGNFLIENNPKIYKIDSFLGLEEVSGNFKISSNSSLEYINSFNSLRTVSGYFYINEWQLKKIESFNQLSFVTDFFDLSSRIDTIIGFNSILEITLLNSDLPVFSHLNGFNSLEIVNGSIRANGGEEKMILGFEKLTRVNGDIWFRNISTIPSFDSLRFVEGNVTIEDSPELLALSFDNLNSVGDFQLSNLNLLESISGLEKLIEAKNISIWANANLLSIPSFSSLLNVNDISFGFSGFETVLLFPILQNAGSISISDCNQIELLAGFEKLELANDISIMRNTKLKTHPKFENLNELRILSIESNDELEPVDGFDKLEIATVINIKDNQRLQTLSGFNGIEGLNTISIEGNSELAVISGFANLVELTGKNTDFNSFNKELKIEDNEALYEIDAFESLDRIYGYLSIQENSIFADCTQPFICNHIARNRNYIIENNGASCSLPDESSEACLRNIPVKIFCFHDVNRNASYDLGEPELTNFRFSNNQDDNILFSSLENPTNVFPEQGDYIVSYIDDNSLWSLSTGQNFYSVDIDYQNIQTDSLYFGFFPTKDVVELVNSISSEITRCNTSPLFEVIVTNTGTKNVNGLLWFEIDPILNDYTFRDIPDTILDNKVGWYFDDLEPTLSFSKKVVVDIPGVSNLPLGEELFFSSYVENFEGMQSEILASAEYRSEVVCAYDPNDKMVQPNRKDHYVLPSELLHYTVRFQNTGNAAAIDVVIRDTLSPLLDASTVSITTSSHRRLLSTFFMEDSILSFSFKNIYLVDSLTSYEGSQGYVSFSISPKDGLAEFDNLNNSASIYFDYNPPIHTNDVISIVAFDQDSDGYFSPDDCDDNDPSLGGASEEVPYNGIDDDCDEDTPDDDLDNDGFLLVDDCDDLNAQINPDAVEILGNDIDENCDGFISSSIGEKRPLISIYPNPAQDEINIKSSVSIDIKVNLVSVLGQVVHSSSKVGAISIRDLEEGVYFLILRSDDYLINVTEKIIIAR